MKKKILALLIAGAMALSSSACGRSSPLDSDSSSKNSTSSTQVSYDIDDFGILYSETQDMFEEKSSNFTLEDLSSDKAYSLYQKCSAKNDLPFNQKVTLTGFKDESRLGFKIESSDGNYSVPCYFKDGAPNLSMFIPHGDEITVTGILSKDKGSYGVLSDCEIQSPKDITPEFSDNIDEVINSDADYNVIEGTVSDVVSLEDFENVMDTLKISEYEHKDYYDSTVLYLTTDDHIIYVLYDPDTFGEIVPGDKIATLGSIDSLMELEKADGTSETIWGFTGNVYDLYIFDN